MLGDFGEVYLLDWGLAKLLGGPELAEPSEKPPVTQRHRSPAAGASTAPPWARPGYMAPEQVRGEDVDARSRRLRARRHPLRAPRAGAAAPAGLARGGVRVDAVRARRAPEHPRAAARPAARARRDLRRARPRWTRETATASARRLVDAVERFLDGDRDLRSDASARRATTRDSRPLTRSRALAVGRRRHRRSRTRALRDAGRALALDPSNTEAVGTLIRLADRATRARFRPRPSQSSRAIDCSAWEPATASRAAPSAAGSLICRRWPSAWAIRSWPAALVTTGAWMVAAAVSTSRASSRGPTAKANLPHAPGRRVRHRVHDVALRAVLLLAGLRRHLRDDVRAGTARSLAARHGGRPRPASPSSSPRLLALDRRHPAALRAGRRPHHHPREHAPLPAPAHRSSSSWSRACRSS